TAIHTVTVPCRRPAPPHPHTLSLHDALPIFRAHDRGGEHRGESPTRRGDDRTGGGPSALWLGIERRIRDCEAPAGHRRLRSQHPPQEELPLARGLRREGVS